MPKRKRPPEIRSRLATSLASHTGSRCATRQMPVPSFRFSVTPAQAARAMNWSWLRQYSSGSGGMSFAPPHGVLRLTGMWLCSGNQSDSKPRSSAALASSTGWIDLSVGKIITPSSMGFSPRGVRRPFYPFQPPTRNQRPGALLDPKCDEDVPRPYRCPRANTVLGAHEQHAPDDRRPMAADRASLGPDAGLFDEEEPEPSWTRG